MLKKGLALLSVLLFAVPVMAKRSGDIAEEPLKVRWYSGKSFRFAYSDAPENRNKLSVAVFLLCRAPQSVPTIQMLNTLAAKYGDSINIAAITPDHADDLKALLSVIPAKGISAGVDADRKLTANFMAGSPLYPMAFLSDAKGRLLWSGEAVDLGEVVSRCFDGKFDAKAAKKISPLLDELHVCMRNNDDRKMNNLVQEILSLDPGNAAALRLRLFSLEQRNRSFEAWQLIYSELEKAPDIARLYFTALDLVLRSRQLTGFLEKILAAFESNIRDAEHRALMAYTLCERVEFNAAAVKMADRLLKDIDTAKLKSPVDAVVFAAKASCAYRFCKLEDAVKFQKKSLELWKRSGSEPNIRASQERLNYFILLGK